MWYGATRENISANAFVLIGAIFNRNIGRVLITGSAVALHCCNPAETPTLKKRWANVKKKPRTYINRWANVNSGTDLISTFRTPYVIDHFAVFYN